MRNLNFPRGRQHTYEKKRAGKDLGILEKIEKKGCEKRFFLLHISMKKGNQINRMIFCSTETEY